MHIGIDTKGEYIFKIILSENNFYKVFLCSEVGIIFKREYEMYSFEMMNYMSSYT